MTENQKLREVLQHAIEDLSSATGFLTRRSRDRQSKTVAALAKLQAVEMLNGLTKAETDASASVSGLTAAPVGEQEVFEREMMDKYGWQRNDFKLDDFGYADGQTDTAWMAWQARAALSAGDAVDAARYRWLRERVGVERTAGGQGPVSCYLYSHQPAFTACLEETDAAIDAAMRKGMP